MYAKIFQQIYSSSIAENWQERLVFMDMLVLADQNGVVDMTHEGIARFTNVPLEIVRACIAALERPDSKSRNPEAGGARIARLESHRDWGWLIVNYEYYREIASEDQRRKKTHERVKRFRLNKKHIGTCNAVVTLGNASNAKERQRHKDKNKYSSAGAVERRVEPPPVTKETSEHHLFIKGWTENFKEFFGFDFKFNGRDAKATSELLELHVARVELLEIAKAAWTRARSDQFASNCKKAATIYGFKDFFNQIRVELSNETNQRNNSKGGRIVADRNAGTLNRPSDYAGIKEKL
jgi:hypothetical protein